MTDRKPVSPPLRIRDKSDYRSENATVPVPRGQYNQSTNQTKSDQAYSLIVAFTQEPVFA
eukprot:9554768-Heterocapsa_arctica.AAC.1